MSQNYSDEIIQVSPYSVLLDQEKENNLKFILFKEGQVVQGREMNVLVHMFNDKIIEVLKRMGIKDGAIMEGDMPTIDGTSFIVPNNIWVWAKGELNNKSTATTLKITGVGHEYVGCTITRSIVDANDYEFLKDPCTAWVSPDGTVELPNEGEAGADRVKYVLSFSTSGYEYVLWHLKDGVIQNTATQPTDFPTIESVERRHRNTVGDGSEHPVNVYSINVDHDTSKLGIDNNTYYVYGKEIGKAQPEFLSINLAKEYVFIDGETKVYHDGTSSYMLNEYPLRDITEMEITVEGYTWVPRGGTDFDLVCDPIGGNPFATYLCPVKGNEVEVLGVYETGTSDPGDAHTSDFTAGVDYTSTNNGIDWSLSGAEPTGDHYWVHHKIRINCVIAVRTLTHVVNEAVVLSGTEYVDLAHNDVVGILCDDNVVRIKIGDDENGDDYIEGIDFSIVNHYDGYTQANKDTNQAWAENDYAQIKWLNAPYPSGTVYVTYDYWVHTKEGHFTCRNSFSDPYHPAINTEELNADWNSGYRKYIFFNTATTDKPVDHSEPSFEYNVYQARRDLVQLDWNANYMIVSGIKGRYPKYPYGWERALTLARIHLPADSSSISIEIVDCVNMRMRDLHELEKRIDEVQSLTIESSMRLDETNKNPPVDHEKVVWSDSMNDGRPNKYGYDHNFSWGGISHNTAFDPLERVHRLGFSIDEITDLVPDAGTSTVRVGDYASRDHSITLNYQTPEQISVPTELKQLLCSGTFNINPYTVFLNGPYINLNPYESNWVDQMTVFSNQLATIENFNSTTNGNASATVPTNTIWNWRVPSATEADRRNWELGINNTLKNMQTFMRQETIKVSGKEFVVGKHVSLTFNEVPVNLTATGDTVQGDNGTVIVEDDGTFTASFVIPSGVPSGSKMVVATETETLRTAKTLFKGVTTREITVVDPPPPPPPVVLPSQSRDPVGQEILVDRSYDIVQVDLYFQSKDNAKSGFFFFRKMRDGDPSDENIGMRVFTPDEVTVHATGATATSFVLSDPIQLEGAKSYLLGIGSASTNYNVFIAEHQKADLNSNPQQVISAQTYDRGNMRSSSNGLSWTIHQQDDLKFCLRPAIYTGSGTLYFTSITKDFTSFVIGANYIIKPNTNLRWYYQINNTGVWTPFIPNEAVELTTLGHSLRIKVDYTSTDSYASPIIRNTVVCHFRTNSSASNYIGRSIDASEDPYFKFSLAVDEYLPSGSSITPYISVDSGLTWESIGEADKSISVGNGFYRKRWQREFNIDPPILNTNDLTPASSGGALANDTFYYIVTCTNEYGETIGSAERSVEVTGGINSGKVTIDMSGNYPTGATGVKVYRGLASGQCYIKYVYDTLPDTIIDDGSDGQSDTDTPPTVPTARDYKNNLKIRFALATSNVCNSPKIRQPYCNGE